MAVNIKWNLQVLIDSGPDLIIPAQKSSVDAYDIVNVTVPAGGNAVRAEITSASKDELQFLAITSDTYDQNISYNTCNQISTAAGYKEGKTTMIMDCPHVFFNNSMIALFSDQIPSCLKFTNNAHNDINVTILVGRKAT